MKIMYISGNPIVPTLLTLTGDARSTPKVILPKASKATYKGIHDFAVNFEKLDASQKKQLTDAFVKQFHRAPFWAGDYQYMGNVYHNAQISRLAENSDVLLGWNFWKAITGGGGNLKDVFNRQARRLPSFVTNKFLPRPQAQVHKRVNPVSLMTFKDFLTRFAHITHEKFETLPVTHKRYIRTRYHAYLKANLKPALHGDEFMGFNFRWFIPGYAVYRAAKGLTTGWNDSGKKPQQAPIAQPVPAITTSTPSVPDTSTPAPSTPIVPGNPPSEYRSSSNDAYIPQNPQGNDGAGGGGQDEAQSQMNLEGDYTYGY